MIPILMFIQAEQLAGRCQWDGSSWVWEITQSRPFWKLQPRQVRVRLNGAGWSVQWLDANGQPMQNPQPLDSLDELVNALNGG